MDNTNSHPGHLQNSAQHGESRRHFIGWLVALMAAKVTDVFWQEELPNTYDDIMAALGKWELTYDQLFRTCSENANKFTAPQKEVLKLRLKELNIQKQIPVETAQNKIPLNETKEQKTARMERIKLADLRKKIMHETNKDIMTPEKWSSLKIGTVGNDTEVKAKKSNWWLKFIIPQGKSLWQMVLHKDFLAWEYSVDFTASEGRVLIWWKGSNGGVELKPGANNSFILTEKTRIDISVFPTSINPEIDVTKFVINEAVPAKILGNN